MKEIVDVVLPLTPMIVALAAVALREGFSSKKLKKMDTKNTKDHKIIFDQVNNLTVHVSRNRATLNRYSDNESFFKSIEETVEEALKYLEEEPKACQYINAVGRCVISFSKDIIRTGIETIKDKVVYTKADGYKNEALTLNIKLFGKEFNKAYESKYSPITKKYLADICKISEDNVNDKQKRFRSMTMVYIETIASNFVNFYLNNKNLIK